VRTAQAQHPQAWTATASSGNQSPACNEPRTAETNACKPWHHSAHPLRRQHRATPCGTTDLEREKTQTQSGTPVARSQTAREIPPPSTPAAPRCEVSRALIQTYAVSSDLDTGNCRFSVMLQTNSGSKRTALLAGTGQSRITAAERIHPPRPGSMRCTSLSTHHIDATSRVRHTTWRRWRRDKSRGGGLASFHSLLRSARHSLGTANEARTIKRPSTISIPTAKHHRENPHSGYPPTLGTFPVRAATIHCVLAADPRSRHTTPKRNSAASVPLRCLATCAAYQQLSPQDLQPQSVTEERDNAPATQNATRLHFRRPAQTPRWSCVSARVQHLSQHSRPAQVSSNSLPLVGLQRARCGISGQIPPSSRDGPGKAKARRRCCSEAGRPVASPGACGRVSFRDTSSACPHHLNSRISIGQLRRTHFSWKSIARRSARP